MNYIIFGFILFLILGVGMTGLLYLLREAEKFYKEADKIEKMIKGDSSKDEIISQLFQLNQISFHRQTHARIRELAKMTEIKFNVKLLK